MHDGLASFEVVRLTGQGPELGDSLAQPIQDSFVAAFQLDNGFDQDCGWPVVVSMSVDEMDLPANGFYAARLRGSSGPFYDVAVTEASIVIETRSGSRLKFRRLGREHLA